MFQSRGFWHRLHLRCQAGWLCLGWGEIRSILGAPIEIILMLSRDHLGIISSPKKVKSNPETAANSPSFQLLCSSQTIFTGRSWPGKLRQDSEPRSDFATWAFRTVGIHQYVRYVLDMYIVIIYIYAYIYILVYIYIYRYTLVSG